MGGFNTLISGLLASVADPLTVSLQVAVSHYAWSDRTEDDFNKPTWGSPTSRQAVVAKASKIVKRTSGVDAGELVLAAYSITFPRPVAVDARDRFVLPGSVEGPIVSVEGVVDPATSVVYATEVFLGVSE